MAANTLPAAGEWTLTGITAEQGGCDCCARRITQRVFHVRHAVHGDMLLGRRCAARATGYAGGRLEQAERIARRTAITQARRAVLRAAYPDIVVGLDAFEVDDVPGFRISNIARVHAFRTVVVTDRMWNGEQVTDEGRSFIAQAA